MSMNRAAVVDHLKNALGEGWTVRESGDEAVIGHGGRGIVFVEGAGPVKVSVRGANDRRKEELTQSVSADADLGKLAPLVEAATWWSGRVSPTNLVPGAKYFVRKPFVDRYEAKVPAGETLTHTRTDYQRYDRTYTVLFLERRIYVRDDSDVMKDFDLHFEKVG
jgi:hypothetical protein